MENQLAIIAANIFCLMLMLGFVGCEISGIKDELKKLNKEK